MICQTRAPNCIEPGGGRFTDISVSYLSAMNLTSLAGIVVLQSSLQVSFWFMLNYPKDQLFTYRRRYDHTFPAFEIRYYSTAMYCLPENRLYTNGHQTKSHQATPFRQFWAFVLAADKHEDAQNSSHKVVRYQTRSERLQSALRHPVLGSQRAVHLGGKRRSPKEGEPGKRMQVLRLRKCAWFTQCRKGMQQEVWKGQIGAAVCFRGAEYECDRG